MKTVKFRGESVHSLMRQVKEEYGDNVLLLSTKQDTPKVVEIEVGLLENSLTEEETTPEEEEVSLEILADMFKESDISAGLAHHGIAPDLYKVLKKSSRAKSWSLETTAKALGKVISCEPYLSEECKYIALFGSKGAGRTTTILKLASRLQSALGIQIGIVAGDYLDEKGAFHLCAMGKLMGVPVVGLDLEVPVSGRLAEATERLGECDAVLIDTPDTDSFDAAARREMEILLGTGSHIEKLLVLPTTKSEEELLKMIRNGVALGCTKGVLSFLDKSGQIGNAINAIWRTGLPLSFVCMGERVPEDIEPASTRRLAWYLSRLVQ